MAPTLTLAAPPPDGAVAHAAQARTTPMAASCRSRTGAILRRCRRSLRDPFLRLVPRSPTLHSLTYARGRPGHSHKQQQNDQKPGSDRPAVHRFDRRRRDALRIVDENAAEGLDSVSA